MEILLKIISLGEKNKLVIQLTAITSTAEEKKLAENINLAKCLTGVDYGRVLKELGKALKYQLKIQQDELEKI